MEQHRPKHDTVIIEGETTTFSVGSTEDVIVHQPQDERVLQAERAVKFALSLGMRLVCLAFSLLIGYLFYGHYPAGQEKIPITPRSGMDLVAVAVIAYTFVSLWRCANNDRQYSVAAILSNWPRVFTRPLFSYFGWTFLFFVFSGLGNTGFTLIASVLILFSSYDMKFKERKSIQVVWTEMNMRSGGR